MQHFFQTFSAIHQSDPVSKALLWNTSHFCNSFKPSPPFISRILFQKFCSGTHPFLQPFFQTFSAIHQSDPVSKALLWNTFLFATLFSNFLRHSSAGFFLKNLLSLQPFFRTFSVIHQPDSSSKTCSGTRPSWQL